MEQRIDYELCKALAIQPSSVQEYKNDLRQILAEICGIRSDEGFTWDCWMGLTRNPDGLHVWAVLRVGDYLSSQPTGEYRVAVPNFPDDLNACAWMEGVLFPRGYAVRGYYASSLEGLVESVRDSSVWSATSLERTVSALWTWITYKDVGGVFSHLPHPNAS